MTPIRFLEIENILKNVNSRVCILSKTKVQAADLVKDYVDGNRNLANNVITLRSFYRLIKILNTGPLKDAALNKFETEYPEIFSKEQSKKFKFLRKRSKTPDEIELEFSKETLDIYRLMGLVSKAKYEKYMHSGNLHEIDDFLATIKLKNHKQQLKFAEIFVRRHKDNLSVVPPIILARAHESLKTKVDSGVRGSTENLLYDVLVQMDNWSNQFASYENINNFVPSSKVQKLYNFVDMTNIASVYDGYREVFKQRLTWFPKNATGLLPNELRSNVKNIDRVMAEYDCEWGLDSFDSDEEDVAQRYEYLKIYAPFWTLSSDAKNQIAKYQFLDKEKNVCPQSERLEKIIELVRYEIVLKNIAKTNKRIDAEKLESDFNNAVLLKLSSMAKDGGNIIEDRAYNRANLDFVNQTADFVGRLNSKFEKIGEQINTDLLPNLFDPLKEIDNRANARFHDPDSGEYNAKVDFFKRIFKTFVSSTLTSAAITGIALGVATVAGISVSASIAVVGVTTGIALAYFQIKKWQKNQIALHKGCGIQDLIKDGRMLTALGPTGIAAIGMIFGAFGLTAVMAVMGYGALGIGVGATSVTIFKDAKAKGLSNVLAAAFAIGNVLAGVVGAVAGRGLVKSIANVNSGSANTNSDANQQTVNDNQTTDNTQPVKEDVVKKTPETTLESTEPVEQTYHEETRLSYTQSGLDNAKRIAHILYQDDVGQLQKHVDMVEQYNAAHGTNIDPYRAAMLRADAGGHVPSNYEIVIDNDGGTRFTNGNIKVFGAGWLKSHPEFTVDDIKAIEKVFDADVASEAGMKAIEKLELSGIVSEKNHVGTVSFPTETVNGINTYSNGASAIIKETVMVPDEIIVQEQPVVEPVVEPVEKPVVAPIMAPVMAPETEMVEKDVKSGVGMFGIFSPKKRWRLKKLRERMGAFFDSMFVQQER
ncbi:MAG: hypothetical protein J6S57_01590 [Alphaproteobacteria bacterium]|nr:hypothetical protein [Alphaproteobacteria bacterium]